jgi:hypothetical protein
MEKLWLSTMPLFVHSHSSHSLLSSSRANSFTVSYALFRADSAEASGKEKVHIDGNDYYLQTEDELSVDETDHKSGLDESDVCICASVCGGMQWECEYGGVGSSVTD